jgi:PAS domain S-box-containing protein
MARAPGVIARETLTLKPLAQSVGQARHAVVDALVAVDQSHHAEAAALATSELVTNAVLYAGSDISVTITVTASLVLVEVEDHSPHEPTRRLYDLSATTGRGLSVVQELTADFGVRRIPGGGKVVWFTLGDRGWFFAGKAFSHGDDDDVTGGIVWLLGVPVALYCSFQQVADGLLREYVLASQALRGGRRTDADEWALATEAFAELASGADPLFCDDAPRGHTDLRFGVRADGTDRFAALARVLARAVTMAHSGRLLALPTQPEIVAMSEWVCTEVQSQMEGRPPTAWLPVQRDHAPPGPAFDWDATRVTSSPLAMVAADDLNRIIAVSDAAAELLHWDPDQLVGMRLVTIVPRAMREAHIAGFMRYLVSGESRIVGRPVGVHALRRDGVEVPITILIEVAAVVGNRQVFVATLTPVGAPGMPAARDAVAQER